jgi:hypothetical protein
MFWTAIRPDRVVDGGPPGYQFREGTSFAAPAAAGAIAYLWRAMPSLTNDQIVSRVQSAALDMGDPGRDDSYGYGLVDMHSAYEQLIADYPMLAPPTVSASPFMRSGQSVSWSASGGHNVSYLLSIDGTLRSTQPGTTYTLPELADGEHTISVLPTSTRNWNTSSVATLAVTLDSVPPSVGGFSRIGETLSWSVNEANPYTVQAHIDASLPVTVVGNAMSVAGLQAGAHTLHVRATDLAGNASAWTAWDFAYGVLPPTVPSIVVTDAVSATLSWPAVSGATLYECVVGTGSARSTTSTVLEADGIGEGATEVRVRAISAEGEQSQWATATITNIAVTPAVPVISTASVIDTPSISASWALAQHARSYEYRLDGGTSTVSSGTAATLPVTGVGPHVLEVRSLNNLRRSSWATSTVTYDPRSSTAITLGASTTRLVYPATTITLTGSVSAPGATLRLQSSADGVTWSEAGTVTATGGPPSTAAIALRPTRSSMYRLVFDGDAVWSSGKWRPAASAALSVAYVPRLTTPSTPSRVKRRARFACTSFVSAVVPNGSSVVTLSFQRYQKVSGRYKWVVRKSIRLRGSVYSATTLRYRASTSLPYSGKWRVGASYSGAPMHANLTSSYRNFTVR